MLNRINIEKPDDYFVNLSNRKSKGVYFCRINGYNREIHDFIKKYHEEARLGGVIIEGRLQNPDNNNLEYYNEMMGMDFRMDSEFIRSRLKKWLPRMNDTQCTNVASSVYETLLRLKQSGKNENMLKNTYIKFMCWLYYKFERIVNRLGDDKLPKILYEGDISSYEFLLMQVLSLAGCDILFLQYHGDAEYKKLDSASVISQELRLNGMVPFPDGFSLKRIREEIKETANMQRLFGDKPKYANCTNAWISGNIFNDVRKKPSERGDTREFFYNCFCRMIGVEDKSAYLNELYQLQLELRNSGRNVVILNNMIQPPDSDEINRIHRGSQQSFEHMAAELTANFSFIGNAELKKTAKKVFLELLIEEKNKDDNNLNKLMNKAVYVICLFKRYYKKFFSGWQMPDVSCLLYLGGCKTDNEVLFIKFLSRLPVDVIILEPDLSRKCDFSDAVLFETNNQYSLDVSEYPEDSSGLRVGTAAYHAERELDELLYQDSGIYRQNQYDKANSVILQTMYEEISILWDQELKYRPNFSTADGIVTIPVICSKVSGVKDSDKNAYWVEIKKLITPDTLLVKKIPHILPSAINPIKPYATNFFRNGKVQKKEIRRHECYQYSILRESMQEHLLDKLQMLIDSRIIKGTLENGIEYLIVATVLNLEKDIVRLIQKFDFTKKNPKLIFVMTGENVLSLEDTILTAFLSLVGFDIVFYVPTGYQCIEKFFAKQLVEEHQAGEFLYDMQIPDFNKISSNTRRKLRDIIFKRGT